MTDYSNKWMVKPVDKDKLMRDRIKTVLKAENLTWRALADKHNAHAGSLQRSIENRLGIVNDFLNTLNYELIIVKKTEKAEAPKSIEQKVY